MSPNRLFAFLLLFLATNSAYAAPTDPQRPLQMLGCYACHRLDGVGGQLGPNLTDIGQELTVLELRLTLVTGQKTDNTQHMPRYDYLPEQELKQLLNVLKQR